LSGLRFTVLQNRVFAEYLILKPVFILCAVGLRLDGEGFHAMPHGIVGTRVKEIQNRSVICPYYFGIVSAL